MDQKEDTHFESRIAVIGLHCRFPGAEGKEAFWQNISEGKISVEFYSEERLRDEGVSPSLLSDKAYVRAQAFLEGGDQFDANFFGYNPREAAEIDPQQRLFLETAWSALEDAGYASGKGVGSVGAFASAGMNFYLRELVRSGIELGDDALGYKVMMGNAADMLPTRVGYKLGVTGPCVGVQTACSSSLVAIHMACQSLLSGECDMAIAGGVSIGSYRREGYLHERGSIRSRDGICRAFEDGSSGTIRGSGSGAVVLKPLEQAEEDGDSIYCVIRGSAINNDGDRKVGYTAPSVDGQTRAISEALAVAGVRSDTIGLVETHGTGTDLGDVVEIKALRKAFQDDLSEEGPCAIGSVKRNIGHLDAAAGVAGFIKAALALKHRIVPGTPDFTQPNPKLPLEGSRFFIPTESYCWDAGEVPRRACVSSFGMGGTNAHAVLEEYENPVDSPAGPLGTEVVLVSASTAESLYRSCERQGRFLEGNEGVSFGDFAATLREGRIHKPYRKAFVSDNASECVGSLLAVPSSRTVGEDLSRSIVFLFPGQGVLELGALGALAESHPILEDEISNCIEILADHGFGDIMESGYGAGEEWREGDSERFSQIALFVFEYALSQFLMRCGIRPLAVSGHSLGELVAATVSGIWSLDTALRIVLERARLMEGTETGKMLAVSRDSLREASIDFSVFGVDLAAKNSPDQWVLSGAAESIDLLKSELDRNRIPNILVNDRRGFHSRLMDATLDPFRECFGKVLFKRGNIPQVSTLTGDWIGERTLGVDHWVSQLRSTVMFEDAGSRLIEGNGQVFVEVGPGQTLSSLLSSRGEFERVAMFPRGVDKLSGRKRLLESMARFWEFGAELNWDVLLGAKEFRRLNLPTYCFDRRRYWLPDFEGDDPVDTAEGTCSIDRSRLSAYVAGRGSIDSVLIEVWEKQLGVRGIGIYDDYFELGGHSLLAIQILKDIKSRFGVELDQATIFANPTIIAISDQIDSLLWARENESVSERTEEVEFI